MKILKNKKFLLSLGVASCVVFPLSSTISCGSETTSSSNGGSTSQGGTNTPANTNNITTLAGAISYSLNYLNNNFKLSDLQNQLNLFVKEQTNIHPLPPTFESSTMNYNNISTPNNNKKLINLSLEQTIKLKNGTTKIDKTSWYNIPIFICFYKENNNLITCLFINNQPKDPSSNQNYPNISDINTSFPYKETQLKQNGTITDHFYSNIVLNDNTLFENKIITNLKNSSLFGYPILKINDLVFTKISPQEIENNLI